MARSLVLLALAVAAVPAAAREVAVGGASLKGYGRIVLTFDAQTKVEVKTANSVLVISFAEPARIRSEKLVGELGTYVSAVRRDPDGTGLRLALQGQYRTSVLEAGERVFIDLLPANWSGLPPSLPPDVVRDLAERARLAEERLKIVEPPKPVPAKRILLRVAELPTVTRFVFERPAGPPPRSGAVEGGTELTFPGPAILDGAGSRPKLAAGVASFDSAGDATSLRVTIRPTAAYRMRSFEEGDSTIVDLTRTGSEPPASAPAVQPTPPPVPTPPGVATALRAREPGPERHAASPALHDDPSPPAAPVAVPVGAPTISETIAPKMERSPHGVSVLFPFRKPTPAAAFERGGVLTLLFETRDRLDSAGIAAPGTAMRLLDARADAGLLHLRFDASRPGPYGLVPEGTGWRLLAGEARLPPDALNVSRTIDENGRGQISISLGGASRTVWLADGDGARLAVVTALGRAQSMATVRRFVDFELPATLHGVVVEARADDLVVGPSQDGAAVTRPKGLAVSPPGIGDSAGRSEQGLVLSRDPVLSDGAAAVVPRYYGLVSDAANAPRSGRAEARYRLARFLVAVGMNAEAASLLSLASSEDQVFSQRRETALLSAIAFVRAGRLDEGRKLLASETIGQEAETEVWRAVLDAEQRRWAASLRGFLRSSEVLDRYPDEIAGWVRLRILAAALGSGDLRRAEGELAAIDRLPIGVLSRDEHDLARARVDEAAGRIEAALKGYERLADEAGIRASSEARLRWTALASRRNVIDRDDAIARLERLSVAWRGDEIEIETVAELARLYGEAGRWRDMFAMTRRANRYFPDHDRTRSLHERSAHLLENLLLGSEGEKLTPVQALSLYFDFKELAPVGRRGDEIVRRLAERLVELDLLDQAADLLQYQVDKRLSGIGKATVAARLAAIRLMGGKPLLALSALQSSRLSDLPDDVRRFRFVLEARAQSDLSRSDLALESIETESGPDFDRLRASILWSARRWREAGEASEALLGQRWSGPQPLTAQERNDVVRAAIAYAAADERIALERLGEKFGRKMRDSPDATSFALLMRPGAPATREFRTVVQGATRTDTLKTLLEEWQAAHRDRAEPESSVL